MSGWRKSWRVPRRIPRKNEETYSGLALRDPVNQRVSHPFSSEEKQGQDRESDLKTLGIEFFLRQRLLAPLSGRFAAQVPHFPNYKQVEDGSEEGQGHHGDADGVLMEAVGRCVNSCGSGR